MCAVGERGTSSARAGIQDKGVYLICYHFRECNWLFEEEIVFILGDNCITTCNTRSKLPIVMRNNLLIALLSKVMEKSFLAQVAPYLLVV